MFVDVRQVASKVNNDMKTIDTALTVPRFMHQVADPDYQTAASLAEETLNALLASYPRASRSHALLCADAETNALWELSNYHTVAKLGINDHGPIHAHLAATAAAQIMQLLIDAGYTPDIIRVGAGAIDDAFVVVVMAGLLHDVGNALHRDSQASNGVVLAQPILRRLLPQVYEDPRQAALLQTAVLSAIATHRTDPTPLTLEGSVVAVADATDMTSGRGKIAFAKGKVDIHAVSALAINRVAIQANDDARPIVIEIDMTSEAGLFQVEETLVRKLRRTPLRDVIAVRACMVNESDPASPNIIDCVALTGNDLRAISSE